GSLFSSLFAQATPSVEKLEWFGTPGGSYALVHVDDLADCFLRAVKKNHLISGLILDCTNERTESVDGILYAFATVVGVSLDKVTYRPPANVLEEAMAVTEHSPKKNRSVSGRAEDERAQSEMKLQDWKSFATKMLSWSLVHGFIRAIGRKVLSLNQIGLSSTGDYAVFVMSSIPLQSLCKDPLQDVDLDSRISWGLANRKEYNLLGQCYKFLDDALERELGQPNVGEVEAEMTPSTQNSVA
ncbi:hypothetical protein PIIN_09964, partial [Serendipita indica DSM 11827]